MDLNRIGTMVIDEQIFPIIGIRFASAQILVWARAPLGLVRTMRSPVGYMIHGDDGSLIWRGYAAFEPFDPDRPDDDIVDLVVSLNIAGQLARSPV